MQLEVRSEEDREASMLRLVLVGALDSDTAPGFDTQLQEAVAGEARLVVLDMAGLDYISSAGLRVIFKAAKALRQDGRRLAAAHRQPQIEKVFEILQALPDMAVFASEEELDAYLDTMQARTRGDG